MFAKSDVEFYKWSCHVLFFVYVCLLFGICDLRVGSSVVVWGGCVWEFPLKNPVLKFYCCQYFPWYLLLHMFIYHKCNAKSRDLVSILFFFPHHQIRVQHNKNGKTKNKNNNKKVLPLHCIEFLMSTQLLSPQFI